MISGLYVYNHKGDIIISRLFRDDVTRAAQDAFRAHVIHSRKPNKSPINVIGKESFLHLYRNQTWVVAVTVENANAMMIFEFLNKFIQLCLAYPTFGGKFTEANVRNNFALIYELLEEVLDNGYPQSTDPDALKIITEDASKKGASLDDLKQIASQVTGQIGWRREGIKYRSNELYIDVIEKVNCLVGSTTGHTLHAHVAGAVKMKSLLSGMPDCKFGINDKVVAGAKDKSKSKSGKKKKEPIAIDDLTFHQCVKLGKFDTNRQITFVPPDGEFELMKYRTTTDVLLPFKITPMVQEAGNHIDITVVIKAEFDKKHAASKLEVKVPVPRSASSVQLNRVSKTGKSKYSAGNNEVIWRMKDFRGGKSATLEISIDLLATASKKKWSKPPINLSFEVPFACSGLQVNYVLVSERKLGYTDSDVKKWVRYLASAGSYETRY